MEQPTRVSQKRYSLRTLILVMTAACLLLGSWSIYIAPYREQARSLAVVHRLKGEAQIVAAEGPGWQRWLVETMLGEETFVQVIRVDLSGRAVDDKALASLTGLRNLQELNLDRSTITDTNSYALQSFPHLKKLFLRFTKLGDSSAEHLGALTELNSLYLTSTQVSDAAIVELLKLNSLQELFVRWSQISDAGAEQLRKALPNCKVYNNLLIREVAAKQ